MWNLKKTGNFISLLFLKKNTKAVMPTEWWEQEAYTYMEWVGGDLSQEFKSKGQK